MGGGQNQKVVLSRVLAASTRFVVANKPTSGLGVLVQAQVLHLMNDLKREMDLTTMFIIHDLKTVRYISDRVAVMYGGNILEMGRAEDIFGRPRHPYTRLLLGLELAEGSVFLEGRMPVPSPPPLCRGRLQKIGARDGRGGSGSWGAMLSGLIHNSARVWELSGTAVCGPVRRGLRRQGWGGVLKDEFVKLVPAPISKRSYGTVS